jgi:hypothetical protein
VVDDSPFLNPDQLNGAERPSRRILASVSGPGGGKNKKRWSTAFSALFL